MFILAAISVLAVLIVVHELGHFLAARLQGIHVNRFSIGFGPILWKYQGEATEYAIRALPLGGFVGFPDDDPDSDIPENDPDLLQNRPILDRVIVVSAGVVANLIFAYLIFVLQFGAFGLQEASEPGVRISQLVSDVNAAAAQAGIQAGDVILSADGRTFDRSLQSIDHLREIIEAHPSQPILLDVQRGDETLNLTVIPQPDASGVGKIGVGLSNNGDLVFRRTRNVFETMGLAAEEFQSILVATVQGFVNLVTNFNQLAGQVAGPVKIVEQGAKLANNNLLNLFPFTAIISINLAIINILPLPALDGGQLAFLLIEGIRGKPLPARIQENVMQTGLVLLLGLGVFIIVRDTTQLEIFQDLLQ
ncbi:MAG: RIP metalloprotease RseP [Leptolyngbyaceae cyanobacterium MO_188.B28]|nr:RIP metalloprotease RseP [Leptolyngbyaceae cyanobacterium MO_188.B28]